MISLASIFSKPRRVSWILVLGSIIAICLIALPLVFLFMRASQAGWEKIWSLISSAHVALLLANTLVLALSTTFLCVVIGVGAAWLVERTRLPGRQIWALLLALPVAVPDFVVGYGWVSIFPAFHGFPAAVFIMTLTLYPLVYLPVAASLRNFDPLLGEISQSLGLNSFQTFFRVTVPQIRTAVLGGCLLVILGLLAEYGAFEMVRFQTFTTAIFTEFTLGFDTQGACAQSLVLVALGLLVLIGEQGASGAGRNVRSGSGAAKRQTRFPLGKWKVLIVFGLTTIMVLSLGVPVASIVYWILQGNSSTLPQSSILSAALNTLEYSAGAALLASVLAVPVALFSLKTRSFAGFIIEKISYLPQAIPGVVIGLSLVFFAINTVTPLYQTPYLIIIAYGIMFFPLALVAVRASSAQAPLRLDEAAFSLGVNRTAVFWRVTLPVVFPGLAAAFALVFISASTELTATLLLHPTGAQTLATRFWTYTSAVSYGAAAPYAALIVVISIFPALLVSKRVEAWPQREHQ